MKNIHIAWIEFQRRQMSMKDYFDFDVFFFPVVRKCSFFYKIFQYFMLGSKTFFLLVKEHPSTVWVQLPQTPLLWIAIAYKYIFNRKLVIIADCHNAMFRRPWNSIPLTQRSLNVADAVVIHNHALQTTAISQGILETKLLVVNDPPAAFNIKNQYFSEQPKPWVVFPASFAADEPVEDLISAAKLLPHVTFFITGNTKNLKQQELLATKPSNVHFLGFVSRDDFDALILSVDIVLALTIHDGIQLSVCGEAVGGEKPLVLSNTSLLRELYPVGTVFVENTGTGIAEGITTALSKISQLQIDMANYHSLSKQNYTNTCVRQYDLFLKKVVL